MLSPTIDSTDDLITQAYNEILGLDGYSQTAQSVMIGSLVPDPDWLAPIRNRVGMLAEAGGTWIADKPTIWGPLLVQFTDYATAFGGVAAQQQQGRISTPDQWIQILKEVLLPQLVASVSATTTTGTALQQHSESFKNVQPLLEESIDQGWAALAHEEEEMVKIASELTHLQDVVGQLEDAITRSDISTGQSVITTTVKMLYNITTGVAESFSFLGMAAGAVTVGKFYYDIIANTAEVGATLQKIGELQLKAGQEAQAAAGTKMVLRLVYDLELTFARIGDVVPQLETLWKTERDKVQSAIAALEAGSDPSSFFDIYTIPTANANWQAINTFALAIPNLQSTQGPPVTLDPQHPISTPR